MQVLWWSKLFKPPVKTPPLLQTHPPICLGLQGLAGRKCPEIGQLPTSSWLTAPYSHQPLVCSRVNSTKWKMKMWPKNIWDFVISQCMWKGWAIIWEMGNIRWLSDHWDPSTPSIVHGPVPTTGTPVCTTHCVVPSHFARLAISHIGRL